MKRRKPAKKTRGAAVDDNDFCAPLIEKDDRMMHIKEMMEKMKSMEVRKVTFISYPACNSSL